MCPRDLRPRAASRRRHTIAVQRLRPFLRYECGTEASKSIESFVELLSGAADALTSWPLRTCRNAGT